MKKTLIFALSLLLTFTLSACGNNDAEPQPEENNGQEIVTAPEVIKDDEPEKEVFEGSHEILVLFNQFTGSQALEGRYGSSFEVISNNTAKVTYGTDTEEANDNAHAHVYIKTDIPEIYGYPDLDRIELTYQGKDRTLDTGGSGLSGEVRVLAVKANEATGGWMGNDAWVMERTIALSGNIFDAEDEPVTVTMPVNKAKLAGLGDVTSLVIYVHSDAGTKDEPTNFTYSDFTVWLIPECCDGMCDDCSCIGFCKFTAEGECCYERPPAVSTADCVGIDSGTIEAVGAVLNNNQATITDQYDGNFIYFDVEIPANNTIYDFAGLSIRYTGIEGDNRYKSLKLSAGAPKSPAGKFNDYPKAANEAGNDLSSNSGVAYITFIFNDQPLRDLYYEGLRTVRFAINVPAEANTVFEIDEIKLDSKSCDNDCAVCYVPPLPGDNYTVPGDNIASDDSFHLKLDSYDYELWSENQQGLSTLNIPPDDDRAGKGGIFGGSWVDTHNVLIRSGRKFSDIRGNSQESTSVLGKTHSEIGEITMDVETTWSTSDSVAYLSVYGWAFYLPDSIPTKTEDGRDVTYSNQIEYYIVKDRKSHNPVRDAKPKGSAIIDGIEYEFFVTDRINQPMLTGTGSFKQYWSMPKYEADFATDGVISVSEHFREWEKCGMIMDGALYEVAWKIESYTGRPSGAKGSAFVHKNILSID